MRRTLLSMAVLLTAFLPGLSSGSQAAASQIGLKVAMSNPVLHADQQQPDFLKVGLTGFRMKSETERPGANIALVLDKSGSMSGEKIEEAKRAAIEAVRQLGPRDIVSVVTYDSTVHVLVPATRLTDADEVCRQISTIEAGGNTALFAGVSKGAAELRKFIDREYVNRIILLSDGLANVGPSSPQELGTLGKSLSKESISVSTLGLGLGYNEDLMVELASHSGGNHVFVERATELAEIFRREFRSVLSVVAQEVAITIQVEPGIRPVRVLGYPAEISGQKVTVQINQLYSEQEKYVILEVEVPASPADAPRRVAAVDVTYANMLTRATDHLKGSASVNFSRSKDEVAASVDADVLKASVMMLSNDRSKQATELRDKGDVAGARRLLRENADYLQEYAVKLKSEELDLLCRENLSQSKNLDAANYVRSRKEMKALQFGIDNQQLEASPARK